ncbi:MAG: hypothetical protein J1E62_10725 [Lachnospiraceae bacterium]|nr:hypothetical protein [Lachnospiraceae bacterium]
MNNFDNEIRKRLKMEEPELPDNYSKRIDNALSERIEYEDGASGNSFRFKPVVTFAVIFFAGIATVWASMNYYHMGSTEKNKMTVSKPGTETDKNSLKGTEEPKMSYELQMIHQEYDMAGQGKKFNGKTVGRIRFSNEKVVCYSYDGNMKSDRADETVYLYERKTKKSHRIMTIKNFNSSWSDMYEQGDWLYKAVGTMDDDGKEKSYIIAINEKTLQGNLIEIKNCNTEFSRVFCTDDTVYVWYINERGKMRNINEYCLCRLENNDLTPVESWTYTTRTDKVRRSNADTGQTMSTMGANDKELFCYVQDANGDAYVNVYDKKGKKGKSIPVDFSDFLKSATEKEDMDVMYDLYCCGNTLFFQTLNHRILVAEYDGKNIKRVDYNLSSPGGNATEKEFDLSSGEYVVLRSFSDKIVICNMYENIDKLYIWEMVSGKIKCIKFEMGDLARNHDLYNTLMEDAEFHYEMLSENEVIVMVDNEEHPILEREYYCKIAP